MILTTTSNIEGKKITKYLGIITGLATIGPGATMFEPSKKVRKEALHEMEIEAKQLGANAVVGINLDLYHKVVDHYKTINAFEVLMVSVSGTAVIIE